MFVLRTFAVMTAASIFGLAVMVLIMSTPRR
jgi:hypothetical protein